MCWMGGVAGALGEDLSEFVCLGMLRGQPSAYGPVLWHAWCLGRLPDARCRERGHQLLERSAGPDAVSAGNDGADLIDQDGSPALEDAGEPEDLSMFRVRLGDFEDVEAGLDARDGKRGTARSGIRACSEVALKQADLDELAAGGELLAETGEHLWRTPSVSLGAHAVSCSVGSATPPTVFLLGRQPRETQLSTALTGVGFGKIKLLADLRKRCLV